MTHRPHLLASPYLVQLYTNYRQAVHVCEDERGTPCSAYADLGFVCVPVWNCRNNLIITDGNVSKGISICRRLCRVMIGD